MAHPILSGNTFRDLTSPLLYAVLGTKLGILPAVFPVIDANMVATYVLNGVILLLINLFFTTVLKGPLENIFKKLSDRLRTFTAWMMRQIQKVPALGKKSLAALWFCIKVIPYLFLWVLQGLGWIVYQIKKGLLYLPLHLHYRVSKRLTIEQWFFLLYTPLIIGFSLWLYFR